MSIVLSDQEVAQRVSAIRAEVVAAIPRARGRRRRHIAIAVAIGAATALTGAAIIVHATSEQIHYEVTCYEHASLSSDYAQAVSVLWIDDNGVAGRTEVDPVATCGDMWRMGSLGQDVPPQDPNSANFPVPALVGCTLPNGASVGFPREGSTASDVDFCKKLGLAPWVQP